MKTIYMAVTNDQYELPVYIEDKLKDLASRLGRKRHSVSSCITKKCACKAAGGEKFLVVRTKVPNRC